MPIKIPKEIEDILLSDQGKEPVAYIDIWEEKGDYDTIDTQNQFKANGSLEVSNDFNIDLDRKPGFVVLAPGKKVDASTTATLFDWGNGTIDWLNFPDVSSTLFQIQVSSNYGWSYINGVIVGVVSITDNFSRFEAYLITSTDGRNFKAVYLIPKRLANFTVGVKTALNERGSNYDAYTVTPQAPRNGNINYSKDGVNILIRDITTIAVDSEAGSTTSSIINSIIYKNNRFFAAGSGSPSQNIAKIYMLDDSVGISSQLIIPMPTGNGNGSIESMVYNSFDGFFYYTYVDSLNNYFIGKADLLTLGAGATHTQVYAFPAGESAHVLRVLPNGKLVTPVFLTGNASSKFYVFDTNNMLFPVSNNYPTTGTVNSFGINSDTDGFVFSDAGGTYVGWTLDGINIAIETVSLHAFPGSLTNQPMSPLVSQTSSFKLNANFEIVNSNHISSLGTGAAGSFNYRVVVEDQFFIDSGRGKK